MRCDPIARFCVWIYITRLNVAPYSRFAVHQNELPHIQEEFLISTTYSTIAARAFSFQGQVLTGVTPR
ncbi:hypothetical protein N7471_012070 [Penicillium samsonianum]|uniref:uncharacterized protein n=1 Tax=Penicillium samsonianum TaxID=1882272 RepID=UPI0025467212|nr:uncharacterized protein N7471_012070 [Penicillium samsonianum]KAJ6124753.1 hypothetical protein N7471_012070 [Penicillium samsonianum]